MSVTGGGQVSSISEVGRKLVEMQQNMGIHGGWLWMEETLELLSF